MVDEQRLHDKLDDLFDIASKANAQHAALATKVDQCTAAVRGVEGKLDVLESRVRKLEQARAYLYGVAAAIAAVGALVIDRVAALFTD